MMILLFISKLKLTVTRQLFEWALCI